MNRKSWLFLVALFVSVVLVWSIFFLPIFFKYSTAGEAFTAASALFSGLAFAGLIVAILLQRQELSSQREELKKQREQLEGQKEQQRLQNKQLEDQSKSLRRQVFENSFFQLIQMRNQIIDSLSYREPGKSSQYKGTKVFEILYSLLKQTIQKKEDLREQVTLYKKSYEKDTLEQYFLFHESLLHFLDRNQSIAIFEHIGILKSQFTQYELAIFLYNYTLLGSQNTFRERIDNFHMFSPLSPSFALDDFYRTTVSIHNVNALEKSIRVL